MIMQSECYPVLHTKYNPNTMFVIDFCLLKKFYWINLVLQNILYPCLHHNHVHVMMCFARFSDYSKQDATTTDSYTKHIIEFLKNQHIVFFNLIKIWENKDSHAEKYICATTLFLLSILSQVYNIMIDHVVSASGHGTVLFDGLKATGKNIFQLMSTMKLPDSQRYGSHLDMKYEDHRANISLSGKF